MAFQKLTWQDSTNASYLKEITENGIPFCAADMNRLENAIADQDSQLDAITNSVSKENIEYKSISVSMGRSDTLDGLKAYVNKIGTIDMGVGFCVLEYMANATDSTFTSITNRDSLVTSFVDYCNGKNINVTMLKPHVVVESQGDDFYRGNYQPTDVNAFFTNWGTILMGYAKLCSDLSIPILSLTCEQTNQTDPKYFTNWQAIINKIKGSYPNVKLTMSLTNWEADRDIKAFKNGINVVETLLDYVGINTYPTLPKVQPMRGFFENNFKINDYAQNIFRDFDFYINYFSNVMRKPILLTETGCIFFTDDTANSVDPIFLPSVWTKNTKYYEGDIVYTSYKNTGIVYQCTASGVSGSIVPSHTSGSAIDGTVTWKYIKLASDYTSQRFWLEALMKYVTNHRNIAGVYLWHVSSPFAILDDTQSKQIISNYYGTRGNN